MKVLAHQPFAYLNSTMCHALAPYTYCYFMKNIEEERNKMNPTREINFPSHCLKPKADGFSKEEKGKD